jgi:hypothetical protein
VAGLVLLLLLGLGAVRVVTDVGEPLDPDPGEGLGVWVFEHVVLPAVVTGGGCLAVVSYTAHQKTAYVKPNTACLRSVSFLPGTSQ